MPPGGNIAASWVAMRALGEDGYMKRAKELMDATDQLKDGVRKIEGLKILGIPHMTCFAIGAADPEIDIQAVADVMDGKGLNFNGIIQIRYFKPLNINQRTYTCILNA